MSHQKDVAVAHYWQDSAREGINGDDAVAVKPGDSSNDETESSRWKKKLANRYRAVRWALCQYCYAASRTIKFRRDLIQQQSDSPILQIGKVSRGAFASLPDSPAHRWPPLALHNGGKYVMTVPVSIKSGDTPPFATLSMPAVGVGVCHSGNKTADSFAYSCFAGAP